MTFAGRLQKYGASQMDPRDANDELTRALVDGSSIRGKPGRSLRKPQIVQGDRGYSSEPHRQRLRERGITPMLAKIGALHGSGLGKTRWQVERSSAWLHSFRRLKIRYER
jgi:transposase